MEEPSSVRFGGRSSSVRIHGRSSNEHLGTGECIGEVASGTIVAAIITFVGGLPAAVEIVQLSGPGAVSTVGRVFQPAKKMW
ncbi:hypothetical protein JHK84_027859 [Glycine max]|nr:hypothetical protein JHK85_028260 [Glycine max]KAG5003602.1 hypothetical protein JHK86_027741 [Glycine max]KAG5151387.1 hypothetical protein JHK84_027859 [Glycine max]